MGIDACPMEGFEAGKFDEILGLKALGLTTSVIAPVGFRADDDVFSTAVKVRRPKEELFSVKHIGQPQEELLVHV